MRCLYAAFLAGSLCLAQNSGSPSAVNPQSDTSQPSSGDVQGAPLFHMETRLVVVDVVATGHDGQPVRGLQKEQFDVREDGKPQTLQVFEEHVPPAHAEDFPIAPLPPGEYSNFPKHVNASAINIVVFDVLNTPITDQLYARAQMIEFLKTLPPGERTALFTMSSDLHMLAGFTTSTDELVAAASHVTPNASAYLDTETDQAESARQIDFANQGLSPSQSTPGGVRSFGQMMQDFADQVEAVRVGDRVVRTFEELGQVARAVSGYPGRKNLIWLSEGFPPGIHPVTGQTLRLSETYLGMFQKYSGILTASQISVYPIDIRGLTVTNSRTMVGAHATMDEIAYETGGEAFYNTNDLKGALKRSIEHGSTYYTLAYIPQNKNWNGKLRKVDVKYRGERVTLHYRRGYYAIKDDPSIVEAAHRTLVAEMQPGVPESTSLFIKAKVSLPDEKSPNLRLDYGIYAPDISFSGDRIHHAKLEWVALAWDKNNQSVAHDSQTMEMDLTPATYLKVQQQGISTHQELTLAPGFYRLRLGVMDYSTGKIGTLEIPVRIPGKALASK